MQQLGRNGYSDDEVLAALRGQRGSRELAFRYDLLDRDNQYLRALDNVLACSVNQSYLSDVKRTARFTLLDDGSINFASDRIMPWVRLKMPGPPAMPDPVLDTPYAQALLDTVGDLRLWYRADETSGTVAHNSASTGSDYDGTITREEMVNAAPLIMEGQSWTLDQTQSDWVNSPLGGTLIQGLDTITAGCWFRPTTLGENDFLIDASTGAVALGLSIRKGTSNQCVVNLELDTGRNLVFTPAGTFPTADTTYFVVVTWTSGHNIEVFVNGVQQTMGVSTGVLNPSGTIVTPDALSLGKWQASVIASNHLNGRLDEVFLAQSYLSTDQALALYNAGLTSPPAVEDETLWDGEPWVEWPQGVFLLPSPNRSIDGAGTVRREVEAYDQLQIWVDDKVTDRFTATFGDFYTEVVSGLLGNIDKNITHSDTFLPVDREWEPATPKLTIINELLAAINYEALWFDEYGTAIVQPYVHPAGRPAEFVYRDDADSVTLPDVNQTVDLFNVPNKWVMVVSDPDRPTALRSEYTNEDADSLTSTLARGRTITDWRTEEEAADQAALDAKVRRLATEASQIYETVTFDTALMPFHSHNDVYTFALGGLTIEAKFAETGWEMTYMAGSSMRHIIRRVVNLIGVVE